jgi:FkbM family methyltransferase
MDVLTKARSIGQRVLHPTRGRVNAFGHGVVGLIDVGSVGHLPRVWDIHAAKINALLKFEPRDTAVQQAHVTTIDAPLWSAVEEHEFYIYRGRSGSGSSMFEQNIDYVRENYEELRNRGPRHLADTWFERCELDKVEHIACTTLDTVLADLTDSFHVLKIDTQGAESHILRGASEYLKSGDCLALHLELFSIPLYKGIALRDEVTLTLKDLGFDEVFVYPPHGSFDSQNDVVFMRRGATGVEADVIRSVYKIK